MKYRVAVEKETKELFLFAARRLKLGATFLESYNSTEVFLVNVSWKNSSMLEINILDCLVGVKWYEPEGESDA